MLLTVANNITQQPSTLQTYLAGTVAPGVTSLPVKNPLGFNNNWAIQLGQVGEESAEVQFMQSASGTVMTLGTSPLNAGTVLYGHNSDTPIYQIHYDQVVFLRSTSGTGGTPSAIGTVPIDPSSQVTEFNDSSGASTYAYQVQYYNSLNGDLSGTSSWFTPGGPTFYSLQKIRQRIKDKLYSAGFVRSDDIFTDWINECYEQMNNAAIKVNESYAQGTAIINVTSGTSGLGTITQTDFKNITKFEVSYDAGNTFTPTSEVKNWSFGDLDFFSGLDPKHVWTGDTTFKILPPPGNTTSCQVRISYSQRFNPLVNDSDEVIMPLKPYTTAFVEYCLGVAYGLDQKDAESQQHYQTYAAIKADFIAESTPRDFTGPKTIDLVEELSGMNEDLALSAEMVI